MNIKFGGASHSSVHSLTRHSEMLYWFVLVIKNHIVIIDSLTNEWYETKQKRHEHNYRFELK